MLEILEGGAVASLFLFGGSFKIPFFTLLALSNRSASPAGSSLKLQIRKVFAVFSKSGLVRNRLRIVLKLILKDPQLFLMLGICYVFDVGSQSVL